MERERAEKVLHCAMTIGEMLLTSGAEVNRVEDTIRRIGMAYGATRVDVFSITSSIVTTMFGEGFEFCTQSRRVSGMKNDFRRLDELNQLSRRICAEKPEPEIVLERIDRIVNGPRYSFGVEVAMYAMISAVFACFFGGDVQDMLASAIVGALLRCFESLLRKAPINALLSSVVASFAGGLMAHVIVRMGLGTHVDLISIGNIMLLIPGVMFTNSLRDMFAGDTITGLIRFAESILIAVTVALGFTLAGLLF